MGVGVLLDRRNVFLDGRGRVQVAAVRFDAARDRVDMHVLEAWHDHAALEVDDLRLRPDVFLCARVGADVYDVVVRNCDRLRPAARAVHRVDRTVRENELGSAGFLFATLIGVIARAARERGRCKQESDRPPDMPVHMLRHW